MSGKSDPSGRITSRIQGTPIAVIGMACLFPRARNLREFWDNILNRVDAITDVPPDHWDVGDYYDPDPKAPDKTYCKRGGFLPEIEFDPVEFGLPPNILEVTDVSQILSLLVAREVLTDAGYGEPSSFDRDRIGIVLGVGGGRPLTSPLTARLQYPVWRKVLRKTGVSEEDTETIIERIKKAYVRWEENSFPGMLGNVVAGRIANRLNLGGMNCVVDAACASSLSALKMAVSELLEHRSDVMITGGVDTDNSIMMYMCFSKTPAFTDADRCRPFDADSQGMMVGEGIGMVALKRLEDAERDRDRIYGVIRGIGTSSDGRFSSIYNPRPEGQAKALRRAYEDAGLRPASVGLIEAHGTGTGAGDPAEVKALRDVFEEGNEKRQYIALGSVKSQIGHTKAAAGAAGLIKVALALHHRVLPPTINVSRPSPKFDLENSAFYLNTETRPWIRTENGVPRRAAVSAFGFGGTNFHVILEEHREKPIGPYRLHTTPQSLLCSAPTPQDLVKECRQVLDDLRSDRAEERYREILDACRSLEVPQEAARVGFVSESLGETLELLTLAVDTLRARGEEESWNLPKGLVYRRKGLDLGGKVVALFSGQGSQYVEMGKELACNFPPVLEAYREMDRLFEKEGWLPLSECVFPRPAFDAAQRQAEERRLRRTEVAQPAIGAFSVGLYRILAQAGFQPDFVAGHSFGELTALWAAEVLGDAEFFSLARARGKAMAAPDDPGFDAGSMLAVIGDAGKIQAEVEDQPAITVANLNSRQEVVLAGPTAELRALQESLTHKGYRVVPLPVSAAFHTSLVEHAQKPFAEAIQATLFHPPKCRIYSNRTGRPYPSDPREIQKALEAHILHPVKFKEEIENIHKDGGRLFVEFGPKGILTKLVGNILEGEPHVAIALNGSPKTSSDLQFRKAVIQMRVAGLALRDVDPYRLHAPVPEKKKSSRATVKLTGANYVSAETRQAFEDALNDGHRIRPEGASAREPAGAGMQQGVEARPGNRSSAANDPFALAGVASGNSKTHVPTGRHTGDAQEVLEVMEQSLALFYRHQSETLRVHEEFLKNHSGYSQTFYELMRQPHLWMGRDSAGTLPGSLERSLVMFHEHQGETLRVHEQYLKHQAEISRSALEVIRREASLLTGVPPSLTPSEATLPVRPSREIPPEAKLAQVQATQRAAEQIPPVPEAAPPPETAPLEQVVSSAEGFQAIRQTLLEVVSQKTGYPAEMLELDMEIEADLGIDSIKRVEILGAMVDRYPDLPETNPEELAELRTLGEIVEYLRARLTAPAVPERRTPSAGAAGTAPASPTAASPAGVVPCAEPPGLEALRQSLLEVVSQKTGYPAEMLELDMEMEADLGIDSIKRVEILGAMVDRYPDLPETNPEELVELRTLGEIVEYLRTRLSSAGSAAVSRSPEEPLEFTSSAFAQEEGVMVRPEPTLLPGGLMQSLLEVVSQKTGYPAEMLELDMEMGTELGIDHVKLVEILGAVRERFPYAGEVDGEVLGGLQTLEDLGRYVQSRILPEAPSGQEMPDADRGLRVCFANLKRLPAPDRLEGSLPADHVCLVTDEGSALTVDLARSLKKEGWKVAVLRFPRSTIRQECPLPPNIPRYELKNLSEKHLQERLEAIREECGRVAGFIHLHPLTPTDAEDGIVFSKTAQEILLTVFLLAKHLKPFLTATEPAGRRFFLTVTRLDGILGVSGGSYSAVEGGLFGLSKTLSREWESVFCRAVDLGPGLDNHRSVSAILGELRDPDLRVVEAGWGERGRVTLAAEDHPTVLPVTRSNRIDSSSVFLVSGGARGVTAECVARLASVYPARFVLLGRSVALPQEPLWARGCEEESELKRRGIEELKRQGEKPTPVRVRELLRPVLTNREIGRTLSAIRKAGGQAEYLSVDVTDAEALRKIAPAIQRFGTITGIIHGAGVLADRMIEKKTIADFESVYATKVKGLEGLLRCVDPDKLKHLILFSSAAGFFGNPGQSDYAMANEILNKLAYQFKKRHPDCHVTSFNWGPWDGGMVTESLKKLFAQRNIQVIPIDAGTQVFVDILSLEGPKALQVLVGSSMRVEGGAVDPQLCTHRIQRTLHLEANPFLADHVIGGKPVLPTVSVMAWMADACGQLYPGHRFVRCENYRTLKGVVFDETLADEYGVDIEEVRKGDTGEILMRVHVFSHPEDRPLQHYAADIVLAPRIPDTPVYEGFDRRESATIEGASLYRDGTLFHGPAFQIVEKVINLGPSKLTAQCRLPQTDPERQGQFPVGTFQSYVSDVLFQCMVVWVRRFTGAASLPSKVARVEQYGSIPPGRAFYVTVDVKECTQTRMAADVLAHDEGGNIYTRMLDAEVTISKHLNQLFAKASS